MDNKDLKASSGEKFAFRNIIRNYESEFGVGISLAILFIFLSIASPYFLSGRNLVNVIYQVSTIGILAVGQTMVIITSGIDLSIGSMFAFSGWIMCKSMIIYGVVPGLIIGLAVGILCGLLNGVLISYVKLEPFIVTLGTMSMYHSLTYVISNAKPVTGLPKALVAFDGFKLLGIPSYVLITVIVFILGQLFLSYCKPGRMIYAIGSNERTARYSGVNVNMYKTMAYVITGILVVLGVLVQASHLMATDPDAGNSLNLDSIAGVVIGGTSLLGGKGTMIGTAIGVLIMGFLRNGLNLLGVSSYWQGTAVGAVLIAAVAIERFTNKKNI